MSEEKKKADYTVKNFDILNKHAEEGVAREREITRARRAQTNWQNAKNVSLIMLAIGLLAIMIGLGFRIAQKDVYVSTDSNHSHIIGSNNYYSDNIADPIIGNEVISGRSAENDKKIPSKSITNNEANDKDKINNENINTSISKEINETDSSIPNTTDNDANNLTKSEELKEEDGIIQKSTEKISNIFGAMLPSPESEGSSSVNDTSNTKSPQTSESQNDNQSINEKETAPSSDTRETENNKISPFEELYQATFGKKFATSNKGEKTITESGAIEIIKDSIHQVTDKVEVLHKNVKYAIYTTYYFKNTEKKSLAYPFKQQCWAFTPAKIVLTLSEKHGKGEILKWDEPQTTALDKANISENELDIFRESCEFLS